MSEITTVYQITLGGLGLVISSFFYSMGGRTGGGGKWNRRFIASFILAATVNILCAIRNLWSPWMLAVWPIFSIGFHLGYGADSIGLKILKRSLYAGVVLMAGVLMVFLLGGNAWKVFVPHVFVGISSVWLGIKNPVYAPAEEFLICMILNLFLIAYPFIV